MESVDKTRRVLNADSSERLHLDNIPKHVLHMLFNCEIYHHLEMPKIAVMINQGKWKKLVKFVGRDYVTIFAARHGYIDLIRLIDNPCWYDVVAKAAKHGQLDMLKCIYNENMCHSGLPYSGAKYAARGGHIDMLEWLTNVCKISLDNRLCYEAAKRGHIHVLRWLYDHGCESDERICAYAAEGGHLDVMVWLRLNGHQWNTDTCDQAAKYGHLHVLKWIVSQGCPWDEWTTMLAAKYGHLDILKWAIENGCPCDASACSFAAEGGQLEILKWLVEAGYPLRIEEAGNHASSNGHSEVVEWIRAAKN